MLFVEGLWTSEMVDDDVLLVDLVCSRSLCQPTIFGLLLMVDSIRLCSTELERNSSDE